MNTKNIFKKSSIISIFLILIINTIPFVSSIQLKIHINSEKPELPLEIDWWPMFHHDPTHIGVTSSSAPETNNVLWSYQTDNMISSSPVIYNGKVYASSLDTRIYCFDLTNGSMLWNYTTFDQITTTPVIANNMIYVGSQDSKFYCLDAENGDLIWIYNTTNKIESSPTYKDNNIFFSTSDGYIYCLNANNGSLIWNYQTNSLIYSSSAVTDNYVYFGALDGVFYCLDKSDGKLVWSYETSNEIWSSPAIYNDKVFFGSNDHNVYCLNANNGGIIWTYDTGNEVHSSPAISYGYVYIGSNARGMFCLDINNGDLIWFDSIKNGIWGSPSIADGKIYYGTEGCCTDPTYVFCLDAYNGEKIWEYNIGVSLGIKSSPAIAAGKLVVTTDYGLILVFGENTIFVDANGPYYNIVNKTIQFNGDAYGGTPEYTWFWEFGDGETSNKQNPTHIYKTMKNYTVTLTVTDKEKNSTIDKTWADIKDDINLLPPTIKGPTKGKTRTEYNYTFLSTNPNASDYYLYIDWGDGFNTGWIGPYQSDETVTCSHSWSDKNNYIIKAKIKNHYTESDWRSLEITIPRTKTINIHIFDLFLHAFPFLRFLLRL